MATLQTGTAPNQIPTNGDLGDLAFQSKESVQFTGGRGALSSINLNQIYKEIAATAVDVFVYDTSKDSDGGAWRNRTQHTSWYNEELNTAIRGSRREFPAVAVFIMEADKLTIHDGDDPSLPMWMVFNYGISGSLGTMNMLYAVGGATTAKNGIIVVSGITGWHDGIEQIYLISDTAFWRNSGNVAYWKLDISRRNTNGGYGNFITTEASKFLVSSYGNDVAMTVLANAPIDAATGLPIPTIAVATAGGVSVIKDNGTVVNLSTSPTGGINITKNNDLVFLTNDISTTFATYSIAIPSVTQSSTTFARKYYYGSSARTIVSPIGALSGLYGITGCGTQSFAFPSSGNGGFGLSGLNIVNENFNDYNAGMISYITSKYNTGWMPGDIKGAWLSDNTAGTMVGSELVTNGNFSGGTSGWTALGDTGFSVSSGQATITLTATNGEISQNLPVLPAGTYTLSFDRVGGTHANMYVSLVYQSTGNTAYSVFYANDTTNRTYSGTVTIGANMSLALRFFGYYWGGTASGQTLVIDNIVLRRADPDRSVNAKGLQVFGSITKSAVATGADLVAYSGFSSSNYLMQPYNALLDFTGDFSWSLWYYHVTNSATEYILYRAPFANGQPKTEIFINTDNTLGIYIQDLGALASPAIQPNSWHHIIATRRSGIVSFYLNSVLVNSGASTVNLTNTNAILSLGLRTSGGYNGINGRLALVRASATAPSAEQIAKMYNDEKYLFQDNAKATLYGTSDSVTALAYDEDTQLLHAGTSSGRSVFRGLRRVDNTTTAVGAAISAANGLVAED